MILTVRTLVFRQCSFLCSIFTVLGAGITLKRRSMHNIIHLLLVFAFHI